jgi:hypothetical protein
MSGGNGASSSANWLNAWLYRPMTQALGQPASNRRVPSELTTTSATSATRLIRKDATAP